jgi:large subunit ribosomal protein L16
LAITLNFVVAACVSLLLHPRSFKSKVRQKNRSFLTFKNNRKLTFGTAGLMLLKPIYITSKVIGRFRIFLKKSARKLDRTHRLMWFYIFPHLPVSRKPDGVRMGKGKGKSVGWATAVASGVVLFEFLNLRVGRSLYYSKQMTCRLGVPTKFIADSETLLVFPLTPSRKVLITTFW